MWKHFVADYLSFTKKERTGIFVLLSLIGFFIALPFLFPLFIPQKTYDHRAFEKEIAALEKKQADSAGHYPKRDFAVENNRDDYQSSGKERYSHQPAGELFYFDPNTATATDWKRLGVRDKTIATIQNYLSKGGKFYKQEDIGKIWGFHEDEVKRLMPYIQIKNSHTVEYAAEKPYEKKEYKKPVYTIATVDVNSADTAAFIALPGIGGKLSQRIINFRDKLGGFYKVEQVGETFGLPDSTFQKIKTYLKINSGAVKQLNINKATMEEMKAHPYLRYALANAIVQYRSQHGNYATVADIKKIMAVTDEVFNKVAPYLAVN